MFCGTAGNERGMSKMRVKTQSCIILDQDLASIADSEPKISCWTCVASAGVKGRNCSVDDAVSFRNARVIRMVDLVSTAIVEPEMTVCIWLRHQPFSSSRT
jgi:hypothetical protein